MIKTVIRKLSTRSNKRKPFYKEKRRAEAVNAKTEFNVVESGAIAKKPSGGLLGFLASKMAGDTKVKESLKRAVKQAIKNAKSTNKTKTLLEKKKYKKCLKRLKLMLRFKYFKNAKPGLKRPRKAKLQALWLLYVKKKNLKFKNGNKTVKKKKKLSAATFKWRCPFLVMSNIMKFIFPVWSQKGWSFAKKRKFKTLKFVKKFFTKDELTHMKHLAVLNELKYHPEVGVKVLRAMKDDVMDQLKKARDKKKVRKKTTIIKKSQEEKTNIILLQDFKVLKKKTEIGSKIVLRKAHIKVKKKRSRIVLKMRHLWLHKRLSLRELRKKKLFFFFKKLSRSLKFNINLASRGSHLFLLKKRDEVDFFVKNKPFYMSFFNQVLGLKLPPKGKKGFKSASYRRRVFFIKNLRKIEKFRNLKAKNLNPMFTVSTYFIKNFGNEKIPQVLKDKVAKKVKSKSRGTKVKSKKVKPKRIFRILKALNTKSLLGKSYKQLAKKYQRARHLFYRRSRGFYYKNVSLNFLQKTVKYRLSSKAWNKIARTLWPLWQNQLILHTRGKSNYKITRSKKKKYKNLCSFFFFLSCKLNFNLLKNFFLLKKKFFMLRKQKNNWCRFGDFKLQKKARDNKLFQKLFFVRFYIYNIVLTPILYNKYYIKCINKIKRKKVYNILYNLQCKQYLQCNYINWVYNKVKLNNLKFLFYRTQKKKLVKKKKEQKQVKFIAQNLWTEVQTAFLRRFKRKKKKIKKLKFYMNPAFLTTNYRTYNRQAQRQGRAHLFARTFQLITDGKIRRILPQGRGYFHVEGWHMALMSQRHRFSIYYYIMQRLNLIHRHMNQEKYQYYAQIDHNEYTKKLKLRGGVYKRLKLQKAFKNRYFYKQRRRRFHTNLNLFGVGKHKKFIMRRRPSYNNIFNAKRLHRVTEVWPLKSTGRSAELRKIGQVQFMVFYRRFINMRLQKTLTKNIALNFIPNVDYNNRLRSYTYEWNKTQSKNAALVACFKNEGLLKKAVQLHDEISLITAFRDVKNFVDIYYDHYVTNPENYRYIYDYWSEYLQGFHLTRKGLINLTKGLVSVGLKRIILVMDNVLLNHNYHKTFLKSQKHGRIVYFLRAFFFKEVVNTLNSLMSYLVHIPVKYKIFIHSKIKGLNAGFVVTMLRQMSRRAYPLKSMYFHALFLIRRRLGLKGYRLEFSGRFFRRERAIYQVYKKGPLGRRSYDSLLDYKWKSLVMKFGVSTVRVWIHKYDSNQKEVDIYYYRYLVKKHRSLKLKLKISQKFKRYYSRFVSFETKKENAFIVKAKRATGQEVGQAHYLLYRFVSRKLKEPGRRLKSIRTFKRRNRLHFQTPGLGSSHKLQVFFRNYLSNRVHATSFNHQVVGETATYQGEPIKYTADVFLKTLFFQTNQNIINAKLKNLIFISKRKALLNWIINGALNSTYSDSNFLKQSIEVNIKRGYKFYSNTNKRILFMKKWNSWTTGHFRNSNIIARMQLFFQRGTKVFSRIQAGFWFKNLYLVSKEALSSNVYKFINNFRDLQPNAVVSRFLQMYFLIKKKKKIKKNLENIQKELNVSKITSFYYEEFFFNRFTFGMYKRIKKFNNINYSFYETYSQDLFSLQREARRIFLSVLKKNRLVFYHLLGFINKQEKKLVQNVINISYNEKILKLLLAVKNYKNQSRSRGVTKYLHRVKVHFQRTLIVKNRFYV